MNCIFCQIIAKKRSAEFLYEDEYLVVFKDINPHAPVHLLIVPQQHIPSVNTLDEKNVSIVGKMVLTAKRMAELFGIQAGYRLMINCGRGGGQIIDHLHMHLMGGWGRKPLEL